MNKSSYFLLYLVVIVKTNCKVLVQTFMEEPENVSVREGENVTLACSVDNKVGTLQWTRDDFGVGTENCQGTLLKMKNN